MKRVLIVMAIAVNALGGCADSDDDDDVVPRCNAGGGSGEVVYKCIRIHAGQPGARVPDAGRVGGDSSSPECEVAADCAGVATDAFPCFSCSDGEQQCAAPDCQRGACVVTFPKLCAELQSVFACETDADCDPCLTECSDGTSACVGRCTDGLCPPTIATCGMARQPCPEGTRAHRDCVECGPVDACIRYELACAELCETDADCTRDGTRCTDTGVCDLITPWCG